MYFVNPCDRERFALRMLLLYRKKRTSFNDLRTVNGILYPTFTEACKQLGYLENDKDSFDCLNEASSFATAIQMRSLFVLVLLNCAPSNPRELWDKFRDHMTVDILYRYRQSIGNPTLKLNDELYNVSLNLINEALQKAGSHLSNYLDMPEIFSPLIIPSINLPQLIREELAYNVYELKTFLGENLKKLNKEQQIAYDTIIDRHQNSAAYGKNVYFIDGPGGTGKTFVYKLILAKIRSQQKIALAVASSGIAAQLLPGGRTGHSRFKVPFHLLPTSTCNIPVQSDEAKLIQQSDLILWDECPMQDRKAFEALDRSMRDIMSKVDPNNANYPFGNKLIVFGGDFRQVLPVVKRGNRGNVVNASFNKSLLWEHVTVLRLVTNMRIQTLSGDEKTEAQEFSDYLIRIGEGKEKTFT